MFLQQFHFCAVMYVYGKSFVSVPALWPVHIYGGLKAVDSINVPLI